jgi:predicted  nucleic acid-binding Zn-ribbon protein
MDDRDFRLLKIISFKIRNATKVEVFRFLSRDERIASFIIGEESNGVVMGVIYTYNRTAISTLEPKLLKLDKKRQGQVVLKPDFDFAERIMSVDPSWMVKGDRWPASDIVSGAPGSIVPCIVPQVGASGVMPVDPIPSSVIQTILRKLEAIETKLGGSDDGAVNNDLSIELERVKRENKDLKEEVENLRVQLEETRESTEGGESKYLETIGNLKEENIRVKRQNKDLEQRLREADYQIQRLDEEANIAQRTILELQEKRIRLEKKPAPAPAPVPSRVASPERPRVEVPQTEEEEILEASVLQKLMKQYYDNIFGSGASKIKPKQNINRLDIKVKSGRGHVIIEFQPIDKNKPISKPDWKQAKIVTLEEGKRRIDQVRNLP